MKFFITNEINLLWIFNPNLVFILIVKVTLRCTSLANSIFTSKLLCESQVNGFGLTLFEVCPVKCSQSLVCTQFKVINHSFVLKNFKLVHINIIARWCWNLGNHHSLGFTRQVLYFDSLHLSSTNLHIFVFGLLLNTEFNWCFHCRNRFCIQIFYLKEITQSETIIIVGSFIVLYGNFNFNRFTRTTILAVSTINECLVNIPREV